MTNTMAADGHQPGAAVGRSWDVAVVGAGPAGSRAAELLAARGADVLMLDPKAPWEKPCGGGLTASALRHTPELHELDGVGEPIDELLAVAPNGSSVVVPLRTPYLVVSRQVLSQWGLDRARSAGARFVASGAQVVEYRAGGWSITDSHGIHRRARRLLAADGATSRLRRLLAPGLKPELAPTRVQYTPRTTPRGRAVFSFLPTAQGYVWDFPRPDHDSVGIGVAPGSFGREVLDAALEQYRVAEAGGSATLSEAGAVIATSAWESGSFHQLGGPDYALLGDAAGLADPATGEGIDFAFRSAALAASAFDERMGFATYAKHAHRTFHGEIRRARLMRDWLYRPVVADWIIGRARHVPRAALLLMALCDAINEHASLTGVLVRAALARAPDLRRAEAVCECAAIPTTSTTDRPGDREQNAGGEGDPSDRRLRAVGMTGGTSTVSAAEVPPRQEVSR